MGKLATVPITLVRENEVALRTVNRESEKYLGLIESMKQKGFLGAITVRSQEDPETHQEYYELVDGLHRFSAAKDAGLVEINVDIVDLDDDQVLEAQLMANFHKIETRPVEYSKQLVRILNRHPLMTESELAENLGVSSAFIQQRLNLTKIPDEGVQKLIDAGEISLSNAYALAKLPPEEQAEFVQNAVAMPPDEFVPQVSQRVKELREAKRQGRDAASIEFTPQPHIRKIAEMKEAINNSELHSFLAKDVETKEQAIRRGIEFCLNLDPRSIEAQKAKHDERIQKKEAMLKKRAEERAKKAEEKAAKAAAAAAEAKAALSGESQPDDTQEG